FLQSGGLHTTGGMAIGASIAASSPTPFFASYTLTGDGQLDIDSSLSIGVGPSGAFVQESGRVTVGRSLRIGLAVSDQSGSYTLHDGQLTTGRVELGGGSDASFLQYGGTHNVLDYLNVGQGTSVTFPVGPRAGRYLLAGG